MCADEAVSQVTLSVCLIVKDEEPVLGRCLSAAAQFADELIVLDTGSKDRSVQIAHEYTDLVYYEPWQNSFAKARNLVASKAGCDFVMWLDADDVMYPEDIRKLIELKKELTLNTDTVFITYRNYGFLADLGIRDRIHRREHACKWTGDVHEAIPIEDGWNLMIRPDITIIHKKEYVNEPERNIRIFDGVKSKGRLKGAYALSYYCRELANRDLKDRAMDAWQELLDSGPSASRVQYALVFMTQMLLRLKEYEKCRELIDISTGRYNVPLSAFLCYQSGLAAEGMNDTDEAVRQYRRATELPVNTASGMIEFAGYDDYLSCLKLCALSYDKDDLEGSEEWNSRAGRVWPEGIAWRINREQFFTPPLPSGEEPLVSVILPSYNSETYISGAVSSVLGQSWKNLELIIADDASTDGTCDIIRSFTDPRIRLLRNDSKLGISATLNRAIAESRGDYIAFMDAEDICLPDRLKAQLTYLNNNREIMLLGTSYKLIDHEGRTVVSAVVPPCSPDHYRAGLLLGSPEFCSSSVMIRKTFITGNHLSFRKDLPGPAYFRFFMEASKKGAVSCLADIHLKHRINSISEDQSALYNSIRCDSLRMSGVRLTKQEESRLGKLLPVSGAPAWNRKERDELTMLFAKIRGQLAAEGFPSLKALDEITWSVLNQPLIP